MKNGYGSHLVFQNETLENKANACDYNGLNRDTTNQSRANKISHKLSPKLMKLYQKFYKFI